MGNSKMNFELKVKEIIKETYILTGKINNKDIIDNLTSFVKNNIDKELSYKTNVKAHFTGFKSLIENKDFINFLKEIQPQIKIVYQENFIISEAWGNLCKIGEEVIEHTHKGVSGFCGILYLTDGGPGTYFKEYDLLIQEEIGKFILFHPLLNHSVKKIENNIERITVAFNMEQFKNWEKDTNLIWVNKK
jgi:hypothetical protein